MVCAVASLLFGAKLVIMTGTSLSLRKATDIMRLVKTDEISILAELESKVLTENLSLLSCSTPLFRCPGVMVTDDVDEEFIPSGSQDVIVETEYAQELSWLLLAIRDGLSDTMTNYSRSEFFSILAESASAALSRSGDRTAMLLAVLFDASLMVARSRQQRSDVLRDEVLSCAASLSDLAEKI